MSYDPKCEELAEYFLPSDVARHTVQTLAQRLQTFIEDELETVEVEKEKLAGR